MNKGVFEEFKPDSLYKYFYSISLVTLKSEKNILRRMLNRLEEFERLMRSGKPLPTPKRKW